MATKREKTSFAVSTNLKNALVTAGKYPSLKPDMVVYDGVATDMHLLHGQFDDGSFRTFNITGTTSSFDFVDPNDAALVRVWTERELQVLLGNWDGIQQSDGVLNGSTWTWTIKINGVTKTATDTSKPDAIAKALIKFL